MRKFLKTYWFALSAEAAGIITVIYQIIIIIEERTR
jgi:hypothetical protein